jgi:hypothetical protein
MHVCADLGIDRARGARTLGGAVSASRGLRAGLSDQVLSAAHTAFVDGFRIASLVAAGLALVVAALSRGVPELPLSGDRAVEHSSLPDEPL